MPFKDPEKAKASCRKSQSTPHAKARLKAYLATPERRKIDKNSRLLKGYGITLETYNVLFQKQLGSCAICKKHQKDLRRALDVDHDHKTGKVRGLLCFTCNTHLGIYEKRSSEFVTYLKGDIL